MVEKHFYPNIWGTLSVFLLNIVNILKDKIKDIQTSSKQVLLKICSEKKTVSSSMSTAGPSAPSSQGLIGIALNTLGRLLAPRSLYVCLRQEPDPRMYSSPCLANFSMHVIQGGEIKAFLWG